MQRPGIPREWLVNVAAYSVAGGVTSLAVGALLGWLGRALLPEPISRTGLLVAVVVGIIAIARELGWIVLPLPQLRRQTQRTWAMRFPSTVTAVLWGLDLGLFFTTWFTFAGDWLLVIVAIIARDPAYGAVLFSAYWLGRVLSVWFAPLLSQDARATPQLMDSIRVHRGGFQRLHAVGLAWGITVLIIWLAQGTPA